MASINNRSVKSLKRLDQILTATRWEWEDTSTAVVPMLNDYGDTMLIEVPRARKALERAVKEATRTEEEISGLRAKALNMEKSQKEERDEAVEPLFYHGEDFSIALNLEARLQLGREGGNCMGKQSGADPFYPNQLWGRIASQWEHWLKEPSGAWRLIEAKGYKNSPAKWPKGLLESRDLEAAKAAQVEPKGSRLEKARDFVESCERLIFWAQETRRLAVRAQTAIRAGIEFRVRGREREMFAQKVWVMQTLHGWNWIPDAGVEYTTLDEAWAIALSTLESSELRDSLVLMEQDQTVYEDVGTHVMGWPGLPDLSELKDEWERLVSP